MGKTEGLSMFNKGRARVGYVLVLHTLREKSQIQEDKYHNAPTRMRNLGLNMYFKGSCVTNVDEREQEEREGNERGDGCGHKVNPQHGL